MSTKELLPSLSGDGWVSDSVVTLDKILSYFFSSDYSQSYIYFGKIHSLPYLIATYSSDENTLTSEVEKSLLSLLSGYYDEVIVDIKVNPSTPNNTTLTSGETTNNNNLSIFLEVKDVQGKKLNMSKLLRLKDGSFEALVSENNYGV